MSAPLAGTLGYEDRRHRVKLRAAARVLLAPVIPNHRGERARTAGSVHEPDEQEVAALVGDTLLVEGGLLRARRRDSGQEESGDQESANGFERILSHS